MGGWRDGSMGPSMGGWKGRWVDGWMDPWVDPLMLGWIHRGKSEWDNVLAQRSLTHQNKIYGGRSKLDVQITECKQSPCASEPKNKMNPTADFVR